MIKIVFFDIDGTLLPNESKEIPESTKKAIALLQQKGIKCVIATGRNRMEMENLPLNDLSFDAYLTMNGQLVFDKEYNIIDKHPISKEEMDVLAAIFKAKKIPFEFIGEKRRYINYVDDTVRFVRETTNGTVADIGKYRGENIYQINGFVDQKTRELLDDFLDYCDITSWNDQGIDIISKGGGKATGIKNFIEKFGYAVEETMAFGDGENDIGMLQTVGVGVSMGNGKDKVKEAADYVTDDVDKDGIYNALKHFELI